MIYISDDMSYPFPINVDPQESDRPDPAEYDFEEDD